MSLSAKKDGSFSILIHWKHQHTFSYTFTPDDYSFPLCKHGQGIRDLYSLGFFPVLRASQEQNQLLPSPPCIPPPRTRWQRQPWHCHGAPSTQAGGDNVCLLPSCGHATTNQSLWYFPKNPFIFIGRLFALGLTRGLFSLLKCSRIYLDNRCFYVKGARICF